MRSIVITSAAVVATALYVAALGLTSAGRRGAVDAQGKSAPAWNREAIPQEEATAVQPGALTERQKIHSRLFAGHRTGRKLTELAATGTGDIVVTSLTPKPFIVGTPQCPRYPRPQLRNISQDADAVVVGTLAAKKYSQLTEGGDFIFSDYELKVDEVLKNNAAAPVAPGASVTVARPGGAVLLNGRVVHGLAGNFRPFAAGGRYLLFLKYVPGTNSYQAFGSGSYQLLSETAVSLFRSSSKPDEQPLGAFVTQVRDAISAGRCGSTPSLY